MIKLELQQTDNVLTTINKIKSIRDLNIEVTIPRESILFENSLNLKLIQQQADKMEKSIEFVTEDEIGNVLIDSLSGKSIDYTPEEFMQSQYQEAPKEKKSLPKVKLPKIKIPKFIAAKKGLVIFPIIFLTLIGSFIYYGYTAPKAKAVITVGSQPFPRSITIKIKADSSTEIQEKIVRGDTISITLEETLEKETTGTKIVGEKAQGEITIYNRTLSKIKLKKGDKLIYTGKSTDLNYYLNDDIDVPASTPEDPLDPESPSILGEATVKIVAEDIGDSYNIDEGKPLEFSDYEKTELAGKTKDKISGGKSEEIKIVTEDDMTNLFSELRSTSIQKVEEGIRSKVGLTQKIIEGSIETRITEENYSSEIDEKADKLSLKIKITGTGLAYMEGELNRFIDEYFKDVIPEGYYMPDQDKDINVDVLGRSTNSTLTSEEADIQVTLKAIIIPDIKEEDVRENLRGKTESEAVSMINSLKNIDHYEYSISPAIPFFKKAPKDLERIEVILIKELKEESL